MFTDECPRTSLTSWSALLEAFLRAGPGSYGKRVVRRKVYAKTNGLTAKFLRGLFK
jgi:hypothetical protein